MSIRFKTIGAKFLLWAISMCLALHWTKTVGEDQSPHSTKSHTQAPISTEPIKDIYGVTRFVTAAVMRLGTIDISPLTDSNRALQVTQT